jgi:hypothetical protein
MNARTRIISTAAVLALCASPCPAQEPEHPVLDVETLDIDPSATGLAPEAVFHPLSSGIDRWRDGFAELRTRYELDLETLRVSASTAKGQDRAEAERRVQARKLDFEIAVIELQLALLPTFEPDLLPDAETLETTIVALRESVRQLRGLRESIAERGPAVIPTTLPVNNEED